MSLPLRTRWHLFCIDAEAFQRRHRVTLLYLEAAVWTGLAVAGAIALGYILAAESCERREAETRLPTHLIDGSCRVLLPSGDWIPLDSWRHAEALRLIHKGR